MHLPGARRDRNASREIFRDPPGRAPLHAPAAAQRDFLIVNPLVRIHYIIVMIRGIGLVPWGLKLPFPGSLNLPSYTPHTISGCGEADLLVTKTIIANCGGCPVASVAARGLGPLSYVAWAAVWEEQRNGKRRWEGESDVKNYMLQP